MTIIIRSGPWGAALAVASRLDREDQVPFAIGCLRELSRLTHPSILASGVAEESCLPLPYSIFTCSAETD